MSFKVKAYMSIASEQIPIEEINYSNCSKLSFKNNDVFFTIGDNKSYSREINLTVTENNTDNTHKIKTLHIGNSKIYTLYTLDDVYICDSNRNIKKSLNLSFGEEYSVDLDVNWLINSGLSDDSQIYINFSFIPCEAVIYTKPETKYFSNPKIVSYKNSTIRRDYIAFNNTTGDFWICENRPSALAVKFECWLIDLYKVTKDTDTDEYISELVHTEIYAGKTHNIASLFWYEADRWALPITTNDNIIKSEDFKGTNIYRNTYQDCLESEKQAVEKDPNYNLSYYYFILRPKCSANKTIDFYFMKRGGEGYDYSREWYYGIDLRYQTITGFSKYGYTFDGFYIRNNGYGENPPEGSRLEDKTDYSKIVNADCTVIPNVKGFSGEEYQYINTTQFKHGYANYIPNETKIILDWNLKSVTGSYISIGDSNLYKLKSNFSIDNETIYETYDETCYKVSNVIDKVHTKSTMSDSYSIQWRFDGFYTSNGIKIIDSDGVFKRNVDGYLSGKKWKYDSGCIKGDDCTPITLYAKWIQGGYIELDKDGNAPEGYHGAGGNNSFSAPYKSYLPLAAQFDVPSLYDEEGYKDKDMNFGGYYTLDENGSYDEKIINNTGLFILNTSVTDGIRRSKLKGYKKLHAYWYGDKFTIRAKSNDKDFGNVKDKYQRIKKYNNVIIEAEVENTGKHAFFGWTKKGSDDYISTNPKYTFQVLNSGTYIANFGMRKYEINYKDAGGGKCTAENVLDINDINTFETMASMSIFDLVSYLSTFLPMYSSYSGCDLVDGVKRGNEFLGWYTDSACTNKVTKITSTMTDSVKDTGGVITLYAKWKQNTNTYTVYFDFKEYFDNITTPPSMFVTQFEQLTKISGTNFIPLKTGYIFNGYKDKNGNKVIDRNGYWIKNTLYCDSDGNCIISDALDCVDVQSKTLTLYADYNQPFITNIGLYAQNIEITKVPNNFTFIKNATANKIANIDWINHAFGFPEQTHYSDNQKHYYTNDINDDYNYNKIISDNYFTYDFNYDDEKCLKQTDIVELFETNAEKVEANFYLKNIIYDSVNKKTTLDVGIKENTSVTYPDGYNGIKDVVFYININNNIYKVIASCLSTGTNLMSKFIKTIEVDLPDYFSEINNITIEHVPCFAVRTDDATTYYKQHINFYTCTDTNTDGSLKYTLPTITQNTLLNNATIDTYKTSSFDQIPVVPGIEVTPSVPGGEIEIK